MSSQVSTTIPNSRAIDNKSCDSNLLPYPTCRLPRVGYRILLQLASGRLLSGLLVPLMIGSCPRRHAAASVRLGLHGANSDSPLVSAPAYNARIMTRRVQCSPFAAAAAPIPAMAFIPASCRQLEKNTPSTPTNRTGDPPLCGQCAVSLTLSSFYGPRRLSSTRFTRLSNLCENSTKT